MLIMACLLYAECLEQAVEMWQDSHLLLSARRVVHMWSDVADRSKVMAFIAYFEGKWRYSWLVLPQWLHVQLRERADNQIDAQETMAILLALWNLRDWIISALVFHWVDNDVCCYRCCMVGAQIQA